MIISTPGGSALACIVGFVLLVCLFGDFLLAFLALVAFFKKPIGWIVIALALLNFAVGIHVMSSWSNGLPVEGGWIALRVLTGIFEFPVMMFLLSSH